MKKLLSIAFLMLVAGVAFGQPTVVPTCNSFDATGAPIFSAAIPPNTTGTTNCTDYFGSGNWANSPVPSGTITGFTLVAGGTGYSTPQVVIADGTNPTGTCAATATVMAGVINGFAAPSGTCTGYTIPQVTIVDMGPGWTAGPATCGIAPLPACGSGAMATAVIGPPFVGGMPKFVATDLLPDLKTLIATADTTSFPGTVYYEIALVQYAHSFHSSLPPTTLRGYVQVPSGSVGCPATPAPSYLGPVILAQKNRAARVKFTNCLPTGTGGNLFIPTDITYMGAGMSPDGVNKYTENRATLHLHGGATPWISDGTPHQWTVPVGEASVPASLLTGNSVSYVPDMYFLATGAVVPQCSLTVTTNCSGGTPAQLPAGATTNPGQGSLSFYWTNQQGGRLMFYHDHAYGITRLNVYVGEAAGYLLYDPVEEAALATATAPGTITAGDLTHLIPLVIQDKTFVPSAAQIGAQDPTWGANFGTTPGAAHLGDLWYSHVYMPNQNPADPGMANGFGRWDYGAWFFPPQTTLTGAIPPSAVTIDCTSAAFPGVIISPTMPNCPTCGCPITPNVSGTPESFMDTPLVNGLAYPVLHVAPAAYRFKILAAGNDRSWNLSWFVADPTQGKTEVAMLPAVPPYPGALVPLCTAINPVAVPQLGIGLATGLLDATGNPINGTGLPANCWPNYGPLPGIPAPQTMWAADGRLGGAPDPRRAGPPWIQIGSEGGLLPAPVVIPATAINYEQNTRSITITSVAVHGLWLGPAERADAIVDFSQAPAMCAALGVSPCTLILYNDAPTPAPAFDSRLDYFTGDGDQTPIGGAPNTQPGYGPNTRTVMQVIVDQSAPNTVPFSLPALKAAFASTATTTGIFASTQPTTIVPEAIYNTAYNQTFPNTYMSIAANDLGYLNIGGSLPGLVVAKGGTGYSTPVVNITGGGGVNAAGTATQVAGVVNSITLTNPGTGYTSAPAVSIVDMGPGWVSGPATCVPAPGVPACGTGATAAARKFLEQKAIQELFTLDYGRMNATLGVEVPMTTFLTQTTIPLGYVDWPTELIKQGDTQLWKITHNGVDTHFIHFHLFNVQLINRVGWDGSNRQPDANEAGWKDTVRMNPLEDVLVALQPITPTMPFPLPDSVRLNDVTVPAGVADPNISGLDPNSGNVTVTIVNALVNFGWEYVWHCHILGHEENDMMRPMIFEVPPPAPSGLLAAAPLLAPAVQLTWADNSSSETSFTVQRDTVPTFDSPALTVFTVDGTTVGATGFNTPGYGGTVSFQDGTYIAGNIYFYRVRANDNMQPISPNPVPFQQTPQVSGWSNIASVNAAPLTPVVTFTGAPATATYNSTFVVTATTNASSIPTITGTAGVCTVGAVAGTAAHATATVTMIAGTGICTLTANWAADAFFISATATQTTTAQLAPLTIKANNASKVYGATLTFLGTEFTTTGLLGTDTVTSVTLTSAGTAATAAVGTYPIVPSAAVGTGLANYNITYVNGTLTVTAVPLTITANSVAKTYGATVTFLGTEFVAVGLLNTDTVTSVTLTSAGAAATAAVGTYPIVPSAAVGTGLTNYTITYVNGTLTVNPAALTITANNAAKSYGQTLTFLGTEFVAVGLLNGNTVATVTLVSAGAPAAAVPGTYPIVPSAAVGTGLTNYTITYVNGTLTVSKARTATTITSSVPNPSIRGQIVTFSFTVAPQFTGVPSGSVLLTASTGETCTGALTAGAGSCTITFFTGGSRTVTAAYPGDSNFLASTSAPLTQVVSSVDLSTKSLLFGNQLVGTASASQAVTLTNVGTLPLGMTSITISGNFTQNNNCPIGGTLGVGRSCRINVTFRPLTVGVLTGTLSIFDADPTSPQLVSLTGTGVQPTAVLSPTSLNFGTIPRGTGKVLPITLSNTGTAPLTINNIFISGSNRFTQTNNCGGSLGIGFTCTINVRFTSFSAGTFNGTLNVRDNAPGGLQTAALTGIAQ